MHLFGGSAEPANEPEAAPQLTARSGLEERVTALEREMEQLKQQFEGFRRQFE